MKTNICFLLLLALLLFLLFILARGFWSRRFKTACHFALLDLQGNFHVQWTWSGFVARSPWDAPHLAWPRAYHFAFCYWVNLLLSNFSAKCSLTALFTIWTSSTRKCFWSSGSLCSLSRHTCGLEKATKSFTLTIHSIDHITSPPSRISKWERQESWCLGLWSTTPPSRPEHISRSVGAEDQCVLPVSKAEHGSGASLGPRGALGVEAPV